ncbi:MAG TPA: hypothetical protein VKA09_05985 [Nitrososphaeraceae archaeon]|jgi:hypothetical protein|nr:hypothetical protein [Nitrososphaeraceae archaeon]
MENRDNEKKQQSQTILITLSTVLMMTLVSSALSVEQFFVLKRGF